jgi:beta-lactamase regulating signal transducer with metallopeptidase domain
MLFLDLIRVGFAEMSSLPGWAFLLSKVTALLAVAWLVHFSLARVNPRWRVLHWRGVIVGLALLAFWNLGLPEWEFSVAVPQAEVAISAPAAFPMGVADIAADIPASESVGMELVEQVEPAAFPAEFSAPPSPAVPVADESAGASLSWATILLTIWRIGGVVLLARLAIGYVRLARFLSALDEVPDWVLNEVGSVAAVVGGSRSVEVRSSEAFGVPFVCGLRRPVLVLPVRMCEPDGQAQLRAIVAHELTHVASSDFRWNVAIELATILLWFHPLMWRIGSAHRAACDGVCDAVSASYLGDVQGYCRTLAQVALEATAHSAPVGLAMARTCDVRRRIGMLQRRVFGASLGRRAVVAFVLTGLAGLVLLAGLRIALAVGADETDTAAPQSDEVTNVAASRSMEVHVVDTEGKPIDEANITVRGIDASGPVRYQTDVDGNATVELPGHDMASLQLLVSTDRHVTEGASWWSEVTKVKVPAEYTFTLEKGTMLGGVVRDEAGRPITGAEVTVKGQRSFPDIPRWRSINDAVKTDVEGKWRSRRVPRDLKSFRFTIEVDHPDFMSLKLFEREEYPVEELREGSAEAIMREGIVVEGIVADPSGKPVSGALVGRFVDAYESDYPRTTTDEKGRYRLAPCEPGKYVLAVAADDFAPNSREVNVTAGTRAFDLRLQQGSPIRLKVIDEEGRPISGAVAGNVMRGREYAPFMDSSRRASSGKSLHTDTRGRWSQLCAADDELLIHIRKEGYESVQQEFAPSEEEQIVTMKAGRWSVSGQVVDGESKAPITEFFVANGVSGYRPGEPTIWSGREKVVNEEGQYRATWDWKDERRVVRIEADGYYASEANSAGGSEKEVTFNVELRKGQNVTGVVRSPEGKLLAGVDVVLCTPGRGMYLRNGRPEQGRGPLVVQTGDDGRFTFPPETNSYLVMAMHEEGFARVRGKAEIRDIRLQPWARVEGTVRVGGEPGVKEAVKLDFDEQWSRRSGTAAGRISYDYRTKTDGEGSFVFDRVPPGKARVVRFVMIPQGNGMWTETVIDSTPVELVAGQTVQVEMSGIAGDEAKRRVPDRQAREEKGKANQEANAERARRVEAAMRVLDKKPRATEDARIDAAIEVLRNFSISKNEESWARAVRELILRGGPVIPALIEELDRTTRDETMRALGFVLRGIDDPRSVPAMIRAIPRLYPGGGSDHGCRIENDRGLSQFMYDHDNSEKRPKLPKGGARGFSFGRSIREIMPALEKLTGESHGWLELNFATGKGNGIAQHRMKSQAFVEHAERWADWWSKNWQDFVSDESDAQLVQIRESLDECAASITAMPRPEPRDGFPCGAGVTMSGDMRSRAVRLFDEPLVPGLYDFDTGRQPVPARALVNGSPDGVASEELLAWAEREGVELVAMRTKLPGSDTPVYAFKPLGMQVWRIDNERFDELRNKIRYLDEIALPDPWEGLIAQTDEASGKYDGSLTASFLFKTENGVCGALQIKANEGWAYTFIGEGYEGE